MTPEKYRRFSVHNFSCLNTAKFSATDYSKLKFGCNSTAKKFGYELATEFFNSHSDSLIADKVVVITSPYNYVPNAATIMGSHFINKTNELLVEARGRSLEYSTIHRKVSYINDYGFLSKQKRRGLIDNDSFYLNKDFIEDKLLVFIDDVRITGTHEDKLIEILEKEKINNLAFFLYYADYHGNQPDIEAKLNFAHIKSLEDYINLSKEPNHQVIIRPIKYVLSQKDDKLENNLDKFSPEMIEKIYHGCLAEGYFKIPAYQANFSLIRDRYKSLHG